MLSLKQTNCLTVVAIVFAVVFFCESASLAAGRIDDVKITPDLKRVIFKCGGPVDEKMSSSVQRSSLLVIDLPGAVLGDVERSTRTGREAGLEVRVSNYEAQRLYLQYGFISKGVRRAYYTDNREDALIMTLDDVNSTECVDKFNAARGILKFAGLKRTD